MVGSHQVGVVFAYGQTGSGKTHTMSGVMEACMDDVFASAAGEGRRAVTFSYFEVLGTAITDCLVPTQPKGGVQIGGCARHPPRGSIRPAPSVVCAGAPPLPDGGGCTPHAMANWGFRLSPTPSTISVTPIEKF